MTPEERNIPCACRDCPTLVLSTPTESGICEACFDAGCQPDSECLAAKGKATPHSVGSEERNIPLRICLTRAEWDALSQFGEVYAVVEIAIAAVVGDENLLQKLKKAFDRRNEAK